MKNDALDYLQLIDTSILAAVAQGELDLNELAKQALVDRGLDFGGKWVGFQAAKELLNQTECEEQ